MTKVKRARFGEAYQRGNWEEVLDLGRELVSLGDHGEPTGQVPFWTANAAARLGRLYDAVFYTDLARRAVAPSTGLEARVLCNAAYFYRQHGAPGRALEAGDLYLDHHGAYPEEGQRLKPIVLYHLAGAHEVFREWDSAIGHYRTAAELASEAGNAPLAGMSLADLAYVHLQRGATGDVEQAESTLSLVNFGDLNARGRFAYHAVWALCHEAQGRMEASVASLQAAMAAAEECEEPLARERALLTLLQARHAARAGDKGNSLRLALEAAGVFRALGEQHALKGCEELLGTLVDSEEHGA